MHRTQILLEEQQSGVTLQRCTEAVLKLDTDGTNPACVTSRR